MARLSVSIDSSDTLKYLNKLENEFPKQLIEVVNKTTQFGLKKIKSEYPKRSGQARQSFRQAKINKFSREISSNLPQVAALEVGSTAKTIRPKRAKFLTIPIKKGVTTKSRIKQSVLNRLFKQLNNPNGKTNRQIFNDVGVVLSKKANIPRQKGKKILETRRLR